MICLFSLKINWSRLLGGGCAAVDAIVPRLIRSGASAVVADCIMEEVSEIGLRKSV